MHHLPAVLVAIELQYAKHSLTNSNCTVVLFLQVFVSDGAKCDIARLQMMFGAGVVSAVQVTLLRLLTLLPLVQSLLGCCHYRYCCCYHYHCCYQQVL
jgi:hypothetical protein